MKKILIALLIVILMGASVSTIERFTGIKWLYNAYEIGVISYVVCSIMINSKNNKEKHIEK